MPGPADLTIRHYPATEVPALRDTLVTIHSDARAELLGLAFYTPQRFWDRVRSYLTGPGFDLVIGAVNEPVGFAFGSALPADSQWWHGVDGADPALMAETGARTFALRELVTRTKFQRCGYGHRLHDELLAGRREERATLLVRSDNPARDLYLRWGWKPVGILQPFPDSPRFESMILSLR